MRSYWHIKCFNKAGELLWEEKDKPNIIHNDGEKAILSAYFATAQSGYGAPPANLYIGLRSGSLVDTDLLSTITEVTGSGYARIAVSTTTGFTLSLVSSNWQALSSTVTFTAAGTWTAATALFLCTASSGTSGNLISSVALAATRTLGVGDVIQASCFVTLSG